MSFSNKKAVFLRHFLSYLVVLILPILVVGVVVYAHVVQVLTDQSNGNYLKMVEQVHSVIDTKLGEMTEITVNVSNKPELSPAALSNFYEVYRSRNHLAFQEGNSFIAQFALYIRGGKYVYTSQSTYLMPLFYRFFRYVDPEGFTETLDTLTQPAMRVDSGVMSGEADSNRYITFLKPIPPNSYQPYGTVMFLVREESIRQMLRGIVTYPNSNAVIFNEEHEIIASLGDSPILDERRISDLLKQAPEGTRELEIDGEVYFASYTSSASSEWTTLLLVPKDAVMGSVNQAKNRAMAALLIILLVGSAIIYLTMYLNYNPIRQLFSKIDSLNLQIESSRSVLERGLLMDLMQGRFSEKEEFHLQAAGSDIRLKSELYYVVLIDMSHLGKEEMEKVISYWQLTLEQAAIEYYQVESLEPDKLGLIVGAQQDSGPLPWSAWVRTGEQRCGQSITAGIGSPYEDLSYLGKSYLEASTSLQYQYALGSGQAFFYGDQENDSDKTLSASVPLKQRLDLLMSALRETNEAVFHKALTRLTDYIVESDIPLVMSKLVYWELVNLLTRRDETGSDTSAQGKTPLPDIVSISLITSKSQLGAYIHEAGIRLIRQSSLSATTSKADAIAREMLQFVNDNCKNYSFSLQMMAERFNVTPSYMSKLFKDRTGKRLSDYMNERRMEEARQLLLNTDKPLQEIVDNIGYSDVSSFIRKFKVLFGAPPGEFRKDAESRPK